MANYHDIMEVSEQEEYIDTGDALELLQAFAETVRELLLQLDPGDTE